jgi:D-amino peptidase
MTAEVAAAARAVLAAGYDEVIVADGHGNAQNIDPEGLPDNVWLVRSWPRPLLQMQGIETPNIEAGGFVGYHAGSSAQGSVLAHVYSGAAFRSVRVNGEACSEGYLNAALAGEFGVPIIFVSGDQHTVADARRYAPEACGFVAKHSVGWRSESALPPAQVARSLEKEIKKSCQRRSSRPFTIKGPVCLELEMTTQVAAEMLAYLPGVERSGPFGVTSTFKHVQDVIRFIAFAMLYSPSGAPAL